VDNNFVRLAKPYIDDDELNEVKSVLDSGYLTQGPKVEKFEHLVAEFIGTKYAYATTSATTALHLSLVVLGIGRDDEVLVPDFTFPATANVVVQQQAKPVLVDIDIDTFNINTEDLESKVTSKTKAIIPVHAFGLSADMNSILVIAKKHGLFVIEDAACAIGATYHSKPCGSFGEMGCFSFHPRKAITTGEGGMITTNSDVFAERIRLLRNHGGVQSEGRFTFEAAGYNYRMSDIQAAVGIAQMRKLDAIIKRKRELAAEYYERLRGFEEVEVPFEPSWGGHIFQSFVVLTDDQIDRDAVIRNMKELGIETTLGTYALHCQPFFIKTYDYGLDELPNSYRAFKQSLTLPLYYEMNVRDIDRVVEGLINSINKIGK